jgi:6,7-dimethyl-8-ribityllumazine synthase
MKKKILIVSANFYEDIIKSLNIEAIKFLKKKNNFKINSITVPGVFEIPVVISKNIKKYDAFIALGCVIKGETPHFEYISISTINALMNLSIQFKKPIGNGIITCLNKKQAFARSIIGSKKNKGIESAKAIYSLLNLTIR